MLTSFRPVVLIDFSSLPESIRDPEKSRPSGTPGVRPSRMLNLAGPSAAPIEATVAFAQTVTVQKETVSIPTGTKVLMRPGAVRGDGVSTREPFEVLGVDVLEVRLEQDDVLGLVLPEVSLPLGWMSTTPTYSLGPNIALCNTPCIRQEPELADTRSGFEANFDNSLVVSGVPANTLADAVDQEKARLRRYGLSPAQYRELVDVVDQAAEPSEQMPSPLLGLDPNIMQEL